jgi:DNA processing protein
MKLIHLHHFPGMSRKILTAFLEKPVLLNALYDLSPNDLERNLHLKPAFAIRLCHYLQHHNVQSVLDVFKQHKIHTVSINEEMFPFQLKHIPDPPLLIYYQGKPELWRSKQLLSVVGSRKATQNAPVAMKKILTPLIEEGFTIVSGLAMGIDGMAHQLALNSGTIAVLGSGLLHPYPAQNRKLFSEIAENHLALSEYPPSVRPEKRFFPERNRIISGLSRATLVVEAQEKSGSLITADQALEQGRDVYALPGPVNNDNYRGTNYLIQQGAKLIMSAEDILSEYR